MNEHEIKIGMRVLYAPSAGGPRFLATVASLPWALGSGHRVVNLSQLGQDYQRYTQRHRSTVNAAYLGALFPYKDEGDSPSYEQETHASPFAPSWSSSETASDPSPSSSWSSDDSSSSSGSSWDSGSSPDTGSSDSFSGGGGDFGGGGASGEW